jgi:hypothetical protein
VVSVFVLVLRKLGVSRGSIARGREFRWHSYLLLKYRRYQGLIV